MKNIIYISILSVIVFASCKDYDPAISVSDSSATFSAAEIMDLKGFTIFNDAVTHAGIAGELFPADSVTVFAPTNAAFAAWFSDLGVANVTEINATTLANVLRYHTVSGALSASELTASMTTLLTGKNLYLSAGSGLNGKATLGTTDMFSSDGVIHGISTVLDIPADDIMAILSANANYSGLVTELQRTGLDASLSGTTDFTILAPDNTAITAAGIAGMTVANATNALSFHIFSGRDYSVEISDGRKATILGTQANQQQEMNIKDLEFNDVAFVSGNSSADNGVVHFVADVIVEESTNIDFIPTDFQAIIDALDPTVRTGYENIDTEFSFIAPDAAAPTVASFGGDAVAMQDWLDSYTFDGSVALRSQSSGTKVTARNGDSYFVQNTVGNAAPFGFPVFSLNGTSFLSSASVATYNGYRNRIFSGPYPTALPSTTISATLDADANYDLLGKAIEVAGKDAQVDAIGTTFYAISNATFTAEFGLATVAAIEALDPDDDADTISALADMIDAHTVSAVEGQLIIETDLPKQTNAAGDEILWGLVGGTEVIITDVQDPQNSIVSPTVYDIWASNGVIHVLDGTLD